MKKINHDESSLNSQAGSTDKSFKTQKEIAERPNQAYLWKLSVKNFKRLRKAEIGLSHTSIFIGPSGSGKTSALQALKFWHVAISKFHEQNRPASRCVTLSRDDLAFLNLSDLSLCWTDRVTESTSSKANSVSVPAEISVSLQWNQDVYVIAIAAELRADDSIECLIFIPPRCPDAFLRAVVGRRMNLLNAHDYVISHEQLISRQNVDETSTHLQNLSMLRNKCYWLSHWANSDVWTEIKHLMSQIFLTRLEDVTINQQNGSLELLYSDDVAESLELSSSSNALQRFLGLVANIAFFRNSWILIDEPEIGIEPHRLSSLYRNLYRLSEISNVEMVVATHSQGFAYKTRTNETITSFLGTPHRFPNRKRLENRNELNAFRISNIKSHGWVLFLEGRSDLDMLRGFAQRLNHPVLDYLEESASKFVRNGAATCYRQYNLLKLAVPDLRAIVLFDRDPVGVKPDAEFEHLAWTRKEIENYLLHEESLLRFAEYFVGKHLAEIPGNEARRRMQLYIEECIPEGAPRSLEDRAWDDIKVSDKFLCPLFEKFFDDLVPGFYAQTNKSIFAEVIQFLPNDFISDEVHVVLDRILVIARDKNAVETETCRQQILSIGNSIDT